MWLLSEKVEDIRLKPPLGLFEAVSTFGTLLYYVVANPSALRLRAKPRKSPQTISVAGLLGCATLAFALAPTDIAIGVSMMIFGRGLQAGQVVLPFPAGPPLDEGTFLLNDNRLRSLNACSAASPEI